MEEVKSSVVVAEGSNGHSNEIPEENSVELTRDAILSREFVPEIKRVDVPEWGGHVYVRELSGAQRDAFELSTVKGRGANRDVNLQNLRARLVAYAIVDSKGNRLFSKDDVDALGKKSSKALTRVYIVAQRISNITDEDVEELTKTLGEDRNGASGSDSL